MPTTVKDGGVVKRWIRDGLELNRVYMGASPWFGGPNGLVFLNRPQVQNQLWLQIRNWYHPEHSDASIIWINLATGDFRGHNAWVDFARGGMISGTGWDGWTVNSAIPGLAINGIQVGARTSEMVWVPRDGNSNAQIASMGGQYVTNWVITFASYLPGLTRDRLGEYSSASVSIQNSDGSNKWIHQVPSPANGWWLGIRGDEGNGDHYGDFDVYLTLN